jgi:D-alanyl-D-alanine carboxypeptidase (penicillin-binding protein 5/6)
MNALAKQINLNDTTFDNPHGLANRYNVSTITDLAMATREFLKSQDFKNIVNTKIYKGRLRNCLGEAVVELKW